MKMAGSGGSGTRVTVLRLRRGGDEEKGKEVKGRGSEEEQS